MSRGLGPHVWEDHKSYSQDQGRKVGVAGDLVSLKKELGPCGF